MLWHNLPSCKNEWARRKLAARCVQPGQGEIVDRWVDEVIVKLGGPKALCSVLKFVVGSLVLPYWIWNGLSDLEKGDNSGVRMFVNGSFVAEGVAAVVCVCASSSSAND